VRVSSKIFLPSSWGIWVNPKFSVSNFFLCGCSTFASPVCDFCLENAGKCAFQAKNTFHFFKISLTKELLALVVSEI
jgi:hypothetical protein